MLWQPSLRRSFVRSLATEHPVGTSLSSSATRLPAVTPTPSPLSTSLLLSVSSSSSGDDAVEMAKKLTEQVPRQLEHLAACLAAIKHGSASPSPLCRSVAAVETLIHTMERQKTFKDRLVELERFQQDLPRLLLRPSSTVCPPGQVMAAFLHAPYDTSNVHAILRREEASRRLSRRMERAFAAALTTQLAVDHAVVAIRRAISTDATQGRERLLVEDLGVCQVVDESIEWVLQRISRASKSPGIPVPVIRVTVLPTLRQDDGGCIERAVPDVGAIRVVHVPAFLRGILVSCIELAAVDALRAMDGSNTTTPPTIDVSIADGSGIGSDICIRVEDQAGAVGGWRAVQSMWRSSVQTSDRHPTAGSSVVDVLPLHGVMAARAAARCFGGDIRVAAMEGLGRAMHIYARAGMLDGVGWHIGHDGIYHGQDVDGHEGDKLMHHSSV